MMCAPWLPCSFFVRGMLISDVIPVPPWGVRLKFVFLSLSLFCAAVEFQLLHGKALVMG